MRTLRIVLNLGLTRGILGGIIGVLLGLGVTVLIRGAMGLETWATGDAKFQAGTALGVPFAIAQITGTLGFLVGVGSMTDWLKWSVGKAGSDGHYHPRKNMPEWTRYFGMDTNHKVVGLQYFVLSMLILGVGGFYALGMRTELAEPGLQIMSEDTYNTFIGMHGMLMIVSVLIGIGAMANYLVPIMIGAQDMAFPRLNGFAFWINVPGGVMLSLAPFVGGFDTGWTAYPPLSTFAPLGMQFFLIGVFVAGFSSILGALNLLTTIFLMRAPGMSLFRMPIFVWGVVATSLIQLTATQFIGLSFLMVAIERLVGIPFFDPSRGGDVTLFQHIFWFYSHPAVYVFVLPGLGIISELLPVFSRKPLFGYVPIALSSMAIAVMGYLVWAHHMFTSAMDPNLRIPFMVTTLMVAVPTGVKFFSWLGTLWGGKIHFATPMLFVTGAFMVFLLGGLTGPPNALVVTGLHLHDTHYVVAHFHMTIFGGYVFAFFAAIYYWFPKVTGRMYSEMWGKIHFALMFTGFVTFTLALTRIGMLGMRRRIVDYDPLLGFENWNMAATIGGFAVAIGVSVMVVNILFNAKYGVKASSNPWRSRGLEWQISSPPPELNFSALPEIVGNPYDYGLEGSVYAVVAEQDRPLDSFDGPTDISGPRVQQPVPAPAPSGD